MPIIFRNYRVRPRCIVSDPAQPHNVSRRAYQKIKHNCFACKNDEAPWVAERYDDLRFYCTTCDLEFHDLCLQFPSKMIHPYHPQHPLTFTFLNYETGIMADTSYREFYKVLSCFEDMSGYLKTIWPKSNIMFDKCTWCRNDLGEWFYRCSMCNFSLDLHCSTNIPPLTIENPKSHHHSLVLFPRPLSFPCDACGLVNILEPSYACYQCSYVVHKSCIDLPRVIKITRHPHRLTHTAYLPTKVSSCRVCYKNLDIKYGQYSCSYEDCSYTVHSKCATHEKVWDGRDLEWEPEESDQTEDIAPFKKVGGDLIEHFCHQHHYLSLEKYDVIRDSEKKCEACILPIRSHDFYNCIECDYFLHEVCANLPRKLDHALHNHPLFIDPYPVYVYKNDDLKCSACFRVSSGFKYKCRESGCNDDEPFQLDINCILIPECFTHQSHAEHPLFISLSYNNNNNNNKIICQGCKMGVRGYHLQCTLCEFAICYKCATIPNEICYNFDEHPLSLCYGESGVDDTYWCELCEKILDPTEWFYTNRERCTTIHHECLFGEYVYMKSGHTFNYYHHKVEVIGNGSSSRPICPNCHRRSPAPVYFKVYMLDGYATDGCCSFYGIRQGTFDM